MSQIDLDDLPPRIARLLADLSGGDEVVLVRGGLLVARLAVVEDVPAETTLDHPSELAPEEHVAEVMSQFNAMIHDEF
jgi:antitoxin (DNA-binding transcriptional repressor) of toxin-antitoxin stability system